MEKSVKSKLLASLFSWTTHHYPTLSQCMNIHVHMDVGGNTCKGVTRIQLFKTQGKIHTVNKSCHKRVKASQLKTLFSPMAKGEMKQQFGCLSQQVTQIAIWLIVQLQQC